MVRQTKKAGERTTPKKAPPSKERRSPSEATEPRRAKKASRQEGAQKARGFSAPVVLPVQSPVLPQLTAGGFFPWDPKGAGGGNDDGEKVAESKSNSAAPHSKSEGSDRNWLERWRKRFGRSEVSKTDSVKAPQIPPFASSLYEVKSINGGKGHTRKQLASSLAQRIRASPSFFSGEVPSPVFQAATLRTQLEEDLGNKVVVKTDEGEQQFSVDDFFNWSGVFPNVVQSGGRSASPFLNLSDLHFLDGTDRDAGQSAHANQLYSLFANYLERTQDFNLAGQLLLRDLYRSGIEKVSSAESGALATLEFLRNRGFLMGEGSGVPMFMLGWPKEETGEDLIVEFVSPNQRYSFRKTELDDLVFFKGADSFFQPYQTYQVQTWSPEEGPFGNLLFNRYSLGNFVDKFYPEGVRASQGVEEKKFSSGPQVAFPEVWLSNDSPFYDPLPPEDAKRLLSMSKRIAPLMDKIGNGEPLTRADKRLLASAQEEFRLFETELRVKRPRD